MTQVDPNAKQEVEVSLEDVTKFISTNPQALETILETDFAKPVLQPKMDKFFSKGLETWKHNNLGKLVDEEVSKRMPNETAEAKRIREMEMKFAQMEKERSLFELKATSTNLLAEKGLPTAFADFVVAENDTITRSRINDLEMEFKSALNKAVEDKLKNHSAPPTVQQGTNQAPTTDAANMSYAERMALYQNNPSMYRQLFGN